MVKKLSLILPSLTKKIYCLQHCWYCTDADMCYLEVSVPVDCKFPFLICHLPLFQWYLTFNYIHIHNRMKTWIYMVPSNDYSCEHQRFDMYHQFCSLSFKICNRRRNYRIWAHISFFILKHIRDRYTFRFNKNVKQNIIIQKLAKRQSSVLKYLIILTHIF